MHNTLQDWLTYLESKTPCARISLGLERIKAVAKKENLNIFSCPVITVAGTNGKGTTVAGISALLTSMGLKVGSYYSPHLFSFNERIQINQQSVEASVLIKKFEAVEKLREDVQLTYFEFITLVALSCFQDANLDVVVLEVGLGGRLDAVNCVSPNISVVTSIGHDHCEWLGTDLEIIAKEKAGICRPNIPMIVGREAILSSLIEVAKKCNAKLYNSGEEFRWKDNSRNEWIHQGETLPRTIQSTFDESDLLAMVAVEHFKKLYLQDLVNPNWDLKPIPVSLPGRFITAKEKGVTYFFDVAHNEHGARWLANKVKLQTYTGRLLAVWSSFKDKDLKSIINPFISLVTNWFIAPLNHARGANLEILADTLISSGSKDISKNSDIVSAYNEAKSQARSGDIIVVFGSFETIATVLPATAFMTQKES